jgi:predicted MFS family arabinose efflux permease
MIGSYVAFARLHWSQLLFGALLLALSSFGQTYYISVFGAEIRGAFALSDGAFGATYAAGTFLSALTLSRIGGWIDHTGVRRFTIAVALLLAGACALLAASPHVVVLGLAFYLLRLGGQGLMVHTALTSTARGFPADAGKALGVVLLGFSLAQAIMPSLGVALGQVFGWRAVWAASAPVVLAWAAVALLFLPRLPEDKASRAARRAAAVSAARGPSPWRDRRLWLALPAVLAPAFITTGFFFHQARLAEEKGWTLGWLVGWLVAFAVVQAVTALAIGPVIDRLGPRRLLPVFLAPLGLAMALLGVTDSPAAAPFYLMLSALSAATGATLATALWVDLYGPARLARVRGMVEAAVVVASGTSPIVMGALIDLGVPLRLQALGCAAGVTAASLLARALKGEGAR